MTTCPTEDLLQRLLTEELVPADRSLVELHVEQCTACQETLERMTADPGWRLGTPAALPARPAVLTMQGQLPDEGLSGAETPTGLVTQTVDPADDVLRLLSPSREPGALGRLGAYEVLAWSAGVEWGRFFAASIRACSGWWR